MFVDIANIEEQMFVNRIGHFGSRYGDLAKRYL